MKLIYNLVVKIVAETWGPIHVLRVSGVKKEGFKRGVALTQSQAVVHHLAGPIERYWATFGHL